MSRSTLFTALVSIASLSLLAPVGCAATASDDTANVGGEDDALTAAAQSLVGRYADQHAPFEGFERLTLKANGKYDAENDPGTAMCVTAPCFLPESGTWSASKGPGGTMHLKLKPTGASSKSFTAKKANGQLVLTSGANSQTLDDLDATQPKFCGGIANIPCDAGEECVPNPNDSGCDPTKGGADCGGICQATSSTASCFGAWLDQNGTCRTPADGVYPDSCCVLKK
jgi:hypothetical protein